MHALLLALVSVSVTSERPQGLSAPVSVAVTSEMPGRAHTAYIMAPCVRFKAGSVSVAFSKKAGSGLSASQVFL